MNDTGTPQLPTPRGRGRTLSLIPAGLPRATAGLLAGGLLALTGCAGQDGTDTGPARPLSHTPPATATAAAPTGELLYATAPAGADPNEVRTINADGSGESEIPLSLTGLNLATWSHRGDRLLVDGILVAADQAFRPGLADPNGSHLRILRLPDQPSDMNCRAWAPDDGSLLCSIGDPRPGLFRVSLANQRVTRLTSGADVPWGYSPDGATIAFTRQASFTDGVDEAMLYTVRADGTQLRKLTQYGAMEGHVHQGGSWTPDGTAILTATPQGELVRVDATTGAITPIPLDGDPFAANPAVSPDGTSIAFIARGNGWDIYTAPIDGGPVRVVTQAETDELAPTWRPG